MAARIIRKILKRIKRTLYNNRYLRGADRMSYIYDPEGVLNHQYPEILGIGSLVHYGSVIKHGNNSNIGIIIDMKQIDFNSCLFYVYTDGRIIETALVYPLL